MQLGGDGCSNGVVSSGAAIRSADVDQARILGVSVVSGDEGGENNPGWLTSVSDEYCTDVPNMDMSEFETTPVVEDGVFGVSAGDGDYAAVLFESGAVLTRDMVGQAAAAGIVELKEAALERGAPAHFVNGEYVRRAGELFETLGLSALNPNREAMLANKDILDEQDYDLWCRWEEASASTGMPSTHVHAVTSDSLNAMDGVCKEGQRDDMEGLQLLVDGNLPDRLRRLRENRNSEPRHLSEMVELGDITMTCVLSRGGYELSNNDPVLARKALPNKQIAVSANYDDGSFASFATPTLFDVLQKRGWPVMQGGRRAELADGHLAMTLPRELMVEISVVGPESGQTHVVEILLGELQMRGGLSITLGRNCTLPLHLDEFQSSRATDARNWEKAVRHYQLKRLTCAWQRWGGAKRRRLSRQLRRKIGGEERKRIKEATLDRVMNAVLAVHNLEKGEQHPLGSDCEKPLDRKRLREFREAMRTAVRMGASFLDETNWDEDFNESKEPVGTSPGPLQHEGEEIPQFPNNELGLRLYRVWQEFKELAHPLKPGEHILGVPPYVPRWKDDRRPQPQKIRPPPRNFAEVEKIIQQWLDQGFVVESKMPVVHAHPVHLHVVNNPDSTRKLRLVCVYNTPGGINSCLDTTSFESKPLDMVVDILLRSKLKSTIDVRSYYNQLLVAEEHRHWLAINFNGRTFIPQRLMFGVSDAVSYAVSMLNAHILGDLLQEPNSQFGTVIDDVSFGSDDPDHCVRQFTAVLERFRKHNVRVSFEKMRVGFTELDGVLGYKISGDKHTLSRKRLQGIQNLRCPKTADQARVFIGFVNFLQKYVPGLSLLLKSTQDLAVLAKGRGKNRPLPRTEAGHIDWEAIELAFSVIKEWLLTEPFLYAVNYDRSIYVSTDASKLGGAGFVYQLFDADGSGKPQLRPISFWSHRWSESQSRRLHIVELEVLASFLCVLRHRDMLMLNPYYLVTDCRNFAIAKSSANQMIQRAILGLEGIGAPPVRLHVPGAANVPSDACSRLCAVRPRRSMKSARERALDRWKRGRTVSQEHRQLLEQHHVRNGAHVGAQATLDSLKEASCYWNDMASDCEWWVRTCNVCQAVRTPMLPKQTLRSIITVMEPFSRIQIDIWTPKVESCHKNQYVLICVDTFSLAVKLYALKSTKAAEIAPHLVSLMGFYDGVCETFWTDDAAAFRSSIMEAFTKACGLRHQLVLPLHHHANGYAEHECYEVCRVIRNLLVENKRLNQAEWCLYLPLVEWIRNSTPRLSRAGLTPRQLLNPCSGKRATLMDATMSVKGYIGRWIDTQNSLIELVRCEMANWIDSRMKQIKSEGAVSRMTYDKGDFVLVQNKQKIRTSKLKRPFTGPYEVLGQGSAGTDSYQLFEVLTGKESEHHRDELKLFNYRSMDELVPMAMAGTDFVNIARVVSHTGKGKTGSDAYRFKVQCEGSDDEVFESTWEDVNRSNAYIRYREQHPEFGLPPTTQAPVAGPWYVGTW